MTALLLLLFLVLSTVAIVLGVLGTTNAFAKLKIAHSRPACDETGSGECDFIETKESEVGGCGATLLQPYHEFWGDPSLDSVRCSRGVWDWWSRRILGVGFTWAWIPMEPVHQ